MNIVEVNYQWAKPLYKRSNTTFCVIHHCGGGGMSVQQIHQMHIGNGWAGIGYHFIIRRDGVIYRGRPIDTIGTHTMNYNGNTIGVCFEGNMETQNLTQAQFNSGVELLADILEKYPNIKFKRHKDLNATACPGKNFPFELMTEGAEDMALTGAEIEKKLTEYYEAKYNATDKIWAEPLIKKAINHGITDGSMLAAPIPGYRVVALLEKAYEKGLADAKK